jgi:hypothetical protein
MSIDTLKIVVCDGGKSDTHTVIESDEKENSTDGQKSKKSLLYKTLNYNQTIRSKMQQAVSPTAFFAVQTGINLATQTAKQFINYYVSDIGRANGDSNYQAIVNRRIEVVTDVASVFGGALSGAAAGSMAGPVGAAVGAVVGAVSSGVNLGFKYAERERAYQHEMFKENTSQAYQLARANYSALTGRVR